MKFVKIILLILVFTLTSSLAVLNYLKDNTSNYHNPLDSTKSAFYQNLKFALSSNNINLFSPVNIDVFTQKITFKAVNPHNNAIASVIFTTKKDPFIQSASLQKIFNLATIRNKNVYLIDLSLNHPYASLKDN